MIVHPRVVVCTEVCSVVEVLANSVTGSEIKGRPFDRDEIPSRHGIAIDFNHAGSVDPQMMAKNVVALVLECIQVPVIAKSASKYNLGVMIYQYICWVSIMGVFSEAVAWTVVLSTPPLETVCVALGETN